MKEFIMLAVGYSFIYLAVFCWNSKEVEFLSKKWFYIVALVTIGGVILRMS